MSGEHPRYAVPFVRNQETPNAKPSLLIPLSWREVQIVDTNILLYAVSHHPAEREKSLMFRHGLRMSEACQDETWPGGHRKPRAARVS
jgi:hypothetical protein